MWYIISNAYVPNSAATNHNLCFLRGLSELGVEAQFVLVHPDSRQSTWENPYKGIKVRYLWRRFRVLNSLTSYISFFLFLFFTLKRGDSVLLLGAPSLLHPLVNKRGLFVYHERTENPEVVDVNKSLYSKKKYYRDCTRVNGLFVISTALKEFFKSHGVLEDRVHIVNMVVDETRFLDIHKENVEPYIAYCGSASNNKDGVDDLIKSFALVHDIYPLIKLYIIGKTPSSQQLFCNMELVRSLGLSDFVVFTGEVQSNKIPQLLKNATILALARPNNIQALYGFPTKLGEYLLTSNPVVITSVGDIPLFLEDGVNAMVAEPENPQHFSQKICWLLEHPEEAKKIGRNGCELAKSQFNYLQETKKIYQVMVDLS